MEQRRIALLGDTSLYRYLAFQFSPFT